MRSYLSTHRKKMKKFTPIWAIKLASNLENINEILVQNTYYYYNKHIIIEAGEQEMPNCQMFKNRSSIILI